MMTYAQLYQVILHKVALRNLGITMVNKHRYSSNEILKHTNTLPFTYWQGSNVFFRIIKNLLL